MPKMSPQDIQNALTNKDRAIELHQDAVKKGFTFSRYLEELDPSFDHKDGLDAFQRQMKLSGIITRSEPAAGIWASSGDVFTDTVQGRALWPEFFAREYRKVMFSNEQERAILLSSDAVLGTFERPYNDVGGPRWLNQFSPAIPLSEIVAITTPVTGEDFRVMYMEYDAEQLRMFRVGESAEIPMANLTTSQKSLSVKKYGRGLRMTYEQMRRQRVNKLAWWIRWVAVQSEVDKVAAAMDILVTGDGTPNTAATEYNLGTLAPDGFVAGELSMVGWLKFRMQFEPPYVMTTALAQIDETIQIITLNMGTANYPLEGRSIGGIGNRLTPINSTADGVRYGWTAEAPNNKIIGFDNRAALEQFIEIGSTISETERYITSQTQVLTMTENSAFGILDPGATKVLDLAE